MSDKEYLNMKAGDYARIERGLLKRMRMDGDEDGG
jgi:hypothetical protein